jgi:hypothetical protein
MRTSKRGEGVHLNKNTTLFIILLSLIFVLSASALAFQINPVQLVDVRMKPVTYFSPSNSLGVSFIFNYTLAEGENFNLNYVNAKDIFPLGMYDGKDYSHLVPVCKQQNNTNTFVCKSQLLKVKTSNYTLNITVFGKYTAPNNTEYDKAESTIIKLIIDNTNPQVTFLGTSACKEGKCYIASDKVNRIQITMKDERATFDGAKVKYKVGTRALPVDMCKGMSCNGTAKITCSDGEIVSLNIVHDGSTYSRDDIGNKINGSATELICDSTPPSIISKSFSSAIGTDTMVIGKDMIFQFNVTDATSPTLDMIIDASEAAGGNETVQCTKPTSDATLFICQKAIKPQVEAPGTYVFTATFKDIVGRETKESFSVPILKTTNETPNNWKVASVVQSSNEFSRPNLAFERTFFAQVNLQALGDTQMVSIKPDGNCYALEENKTGKSTDIASVKLVSKQASSIYLKLALRENNDGRYDSLDNLTYICPISISSKKGSYYFSTPEKDNFTITIKLNDEANIQERHKREVERVTKSVEIQNNIIQKFDTAANMLQGLCRMCAGLSATSGTLGVLETVSAFSVAAAAAPGIGQVSDTINDVEYNSKDICTTVDKWCKVMTCDMNWQNSIEKSFNTYIGGDDADFYKYFGHENLASTLSPYKSYVVAAATGCLPAIMYHYKTFTGIQCSYLECITSDYVQYGQDLGTCKQDRAYNQCLFFTGGALNAVPFVNIARDTTKQLGDFMKNPQNIIGVAVPLVCRGVKAESKLHGPCVSVQGFFVTVKRTLTNTDFIRRVIFAKSKNPTAQCGQIIISSKSAYVPRSQLGYTTEDFDPTARKPVGKGILFCQGRDCEYTLDGNKYQIKVTADKEVLYYYGNKKISPAKMYTENIKQTETSQTAETEVKPTQQNAEALAKKDAEYLRRMAEDPSAANFIQTEMQFSKAVASNMRKGELLMLDQLKTAVESSAIEMTDSIMNRMKTKFGLAESDLKDLETAEQKYGEAVKANQQTILDSENNIKKMEAYQKLYEKSTKDELSKSEKNRMARLQSEIAATEQFRSMNQALFDKQTKATQELESARNILQTTQYDVEGRTDQRNAAEDKIAQAKLAIQKAEAELNDINAQISKKISSTSLSELKDLKEKSEKEIKDADAAFKANLTNVNFQKYFGGPWTNTAMLAWSNIDTIAHLREALNLQWNMINNGGKWSQTADFLIEDVAEFEKFICRAAIKPRQRLGDTVILNMDDNTKYRTGAQVLGRRSNLINAGTEKYYEYFVGGNVVTSKKDGLIVNVILIDEQGLEVNMTDRIIGGPKVLFQDEPYSFGRPKSTYLKDSRKFAKVCMVFSGGSLHEYFDQVNAWDTDRICQKLVSE